MRGSFITRMYTPSTHADRISLHVRTARWVSLDVGMLGRILSPMPSQYRACHVRLQLLSVCQPFQSRRHATTHQPPTRSKTRYEADARRPIAVLRIDSPAEACVCDVPCPPATAAASAAGSDAAALHRTHRKEGLVMLHDAATLQLRLCHSVLLPHLL